LLRHTLRPIAYNLLIWPSCCIKPPVKVIDRGLWHIKIKRRNCFTMHCMLLSGDQSEPF